MNRRQREEIERKSNSEERMRCFEKRYGISIRKALGEELEVVKSSVTSAMRTCHFPLLQR